MLEFLMLKLYDTKFLVMLLTSVAAIATVITLAMPFLSPDTLGRRMKTVALEGEKTRQRERERRPHEVGRGGAREDRPARARAAVARREGQGRAPPVAEAVHAAGGRAAEPDPVAG